MDSGVTTLFVSHDSSAVKTLCNAAVIIDQGKICGSGLPNAMIIEYTRMVTEKELALAEIDARCKLAVLHPTSQQNNWALDKVPVRRGSCKALIEEVKLLNQFAESSGDPVFGFNENVTLLVNLTVYEPLQECIVGFFVCDKNGNEIIGSNTLEENCPIGELQPEDRLQVQFVFKLPLRTGSYSLTVAGSENYTAIAFDWIDNAAVFQVLPPHTGKQIHALVDQPMRVNVLRTLPVASSASIEV